MHTPTQAILGLPRTTAWDMWQLGCCLYEAATGTILFGGLEEAAAAAVAALPSGGGASSSDDESSSGGWWRQRGGSGEAGGGGESAADRRRRRRLERASDAAHLALMRRLLGPPPARLLARSPHVPQFYDARGELAGGFGWGRRRLEQQLADAGGLDTEEVSVRLRWPVARPTAAAFAGR